MGRSAVALRPIGNSWAGGRASVWAGLGGRVSAGAFQWAASRAAKTSLAASTALMAAGKPA